MTVTHHYEVCITWRGSPSRFYCTVWASNPGEAWAQAWDCLRNEMGANTPPFVSCSFESRCLGASPLQRASLAADLPVQAEFVKQIQEKVAQSLGSKLNGEFNTVVCPAGFNYGITYSSNAFYNEATLSDFDSLLSRDATTGVLKLDGSRYSTLYSQIMQSVMFNFSQEDQRTMNEQDTFASAQIACVLTAFENIGGVYTHPLPFGGKIMDIQKQITDLYGSIDAMPSTLSELRNAMADYEAIAGKSYILRSRYSNATKRLKDLADNMTKPSATNGGQQVNTNAFHVGYTPKKLPTAIELLNSLGTESNCISIAMEASDFSSKEINVSIGGRAGFKVSPFSLFRLSSNASANYTLQDYASSGSKVSIEIKYQGITIVGSTPSELSIDGSTGWYDNAILREIAEKTGKDATGYALAGKEYSIDEYFGEGKIFSRLKTFVICQQPIVTMHMEKVNSKKVVSDFKAEASAKLSLLNIFTFGSTEGTYKVHSVDEHSDKESVTVTFGPTKVSSTIPLQEQTAYVLGGVPSYPPQKI